MASCHGSRAGTPSRQHVLMALTKMRERIGDFLARATAWVHVPVGRQPVERGLISVGPLRLPNGGLVGVHAERLHDPAVNLAVGQRYLLQLSQDDSIDGDLIRLLAGYGQGLFGLKRWADSVNDQGDPLLFLEAIPNQATRSFIQDILAWSWH